jgi:hypothetical protein
MTTPTETCPHVRNAFTADGHCLYCVESSEIASQQYDHHVRYCSKCQDAWPCYVGDRLFEQCAKLDRRAGF